MERAEKPVELLVAVWSHGLQAARVVDVHDCGDLVRSSFNGLAGDEHVRGVLIDLEVIRSVLLQGRGCKRPKVLAELHPRVDVVLHLSRIRAGQDGAIAKRTRAKLGAILEPTDDQAVLQLLGDEFVQAIGLGDLNRVRRKRLLDFVGRRPGPEVEVVPLLRLETGIVILF